MICLFNTRWSRHRSNNLFFNVGGSAACYGILLIFSTVWITSAVDLSSCSRALGMQNGTIPDSAIKASSSYDNASVGPSNGRIRTELHGGAWCPRNQIQRNVYEWLEVDFQELKVVTQVETQGRFGHGQGQEYTDSYMLEYKRLEGGPWIRFKDRKGNSTLQGNTNVDSPVVRNISPPIIARKVRIVPYSLHPRSVCLRVEFYGCPWKDGLLSYSMPQGDATTPQRRHNELELLDFTYDGNVTNNYLSGGLGQLTDGVEGQTNFRLDPIETGKKGYEWIGWKNESGDRQPIQILFEFEKVRNFSALRFHCNNAFKRDVRVFRKALLYFGTTSAGFQQKPVVYEYMRDTLMEYTRSVIIPIPHRCGKFIRAELYFDAKWMMISEVLFESEVATGNVTEDILLPAMTVPAIPATQQVFTDYPTDLDSELYDEDEESDAPTDSTKSIQAMDEQMIGVIVGGTVVFCLLLVAVILLCFLRRRNHQKYSQCKHATGARNSAQLMLNMHDAAPCVGRIPSNGKLSNGLLYNSIILGEGHEDPLAQQRKCGTLPVAVNGGLYREPYDGIQMRKLPEPPVPVICSTDDLSDTNTSTYAVPDMILSTCRASNPNISAFSAFHTQTSSFKPFQKSGSPPPLPPAPNPRTVFAGGRLAIEQGCCGNSVFALPVGIDSIWEDTMDIVEFPREKLCYIETLGEGPCGEIRLCETLLMSNLLQHDVENSNTTLPGSKVALVAVKTLLRNADEKARAEFHKEMVTLRCLDDVNVVRLLGVTSHDDPLCIVMEYAKFGDLKNFLQQHISAESTIAKTCNTNVLSYGCLIYMATQIASGMKYLESLSVIHQDLAARNCLVGDGYAIKISDLGMCRQVYASDYCWIDDTVALPIRWMAWESVFLGQFSSKTDVWSFAVTLWEVLSFARSQPFATANNDQVIDNLSHYYRGDGGQVYLPRPPECPKEIYDLMKECWNRDENQRPAFREIHMFLQRKNLGYTHSEEVDSTAVPSVNVPFV